MSTTHGQPSRSRSQALGAATPRHGEFSYGGRRGDSSAALPARGGIFYGWWMTLAAALAMMLQGSLIHYGFGAYFTALVGEFHWSRAQLSGVFSLSRLEGGLIAPVAGIIIDRLGPRRLMISGMFLMGLGFILLSRVSDLLMFYLVYALFIAIGSSFGPAATALTAVGNWFIRRRSTAMGIAFAGFGLGGSMVWLVSLAISNYGWRDVMVGAGILLWGLGIPLSAMMRHRPEQYGLLPDGEVPHPITLPSEGEEAEAPPSTQVAGDASANPRQVLAMSAFWLLAINFSIRQMVTSSVTLHTIPFLSDLGFSSEAAAGVLSAIAVGSILGRIVFGWLGDHYDKRLVMAGSLVLLVVAMAVMSQASSFESVLVYVPLYAMAYGGAVPLVPATLAEYFGRKYFATVSGFSSTVQMVGNICGPLFAGFVFDVTGSYRMAFVSFSVAALVALLTLLFVRKPKLEA